jgi:phosphoenolpyruvate carboxylase
VVTALGAFCDAPSRDDIKAFFTAHPLQSASRTLDQTVERIDNCVALRERQAPALVEWLRNR